MKFFSKAGALLVVLALCTFATTSASASGCRITLSEVLDSNGFSVLLFALEATDPTRSTVIG